MAKRSLVVVESPTKVKTIQKYLDSKYVVKASMGHVRDLPKSKLGVDEKKGFKPEYKVLPAKKKVLDELKKAAEKVDALYIATDPDREGEAIGWHLAQELGVSKSKTHRIMFNEITDRYGLGSLAPAQVQKTWEWVSKANNYPLDKLDPMSAVTAKFVGS